MRMTFLTTAAAAALASTPAAAAELWRLEDAVSESGAKVEVRMSAAAAQLALGETLTLPAPGGKSIDVALRRIDPHAFGGHTFTGAVKAVNGEPVAKGFDMIVTQGTGGAFGQITTPTATYVLYPDKQGRLYLWDREADGGRALEAREDSLVPPAFARSPSGPESAPPIESDVPIGSLGTIDVGVVYTPSMESLWGLALGTRIAFLVAVYNEALRNSDTGVVARLVHVSKTTLFDETSANGCSGAIPPTPGGTGHLCTLTLGAGFGTGVAAGLKTLRDGTAADLFVLLRHFDASLHGSCGTAWRNGFGGEISGSGTSGDAPYGISVTSDWIDKNWSGSGPFSFCLENTFSHENGHNMGMSHNIEDAGGPGVKTDYSYGHRVDGVLRTVMAYSSAGGGETRVNLFSNPDKLLCPPGDTAACGEDPTGPGDDGSDNARATRETGYKVKDFRAEAPGLASSVLPNSRVLEAKVDGSAVASAFAAVINLGGTTATGCGIRLHGIDEAADFVYQTTNASNVLTGTPNTPVSIGPGAVQNFYFAIKADETFDIDDYPPVLFSSNTFDPQEISLDFFCANRRSAESIVGLNTLYYEATAGPVPDIIALAATTGSTGTVVLPSGGTGVGAFAAAISNVGATGSITVSGEVSASLPATVTVCDTTGTVPAGSCAAPPAASVTKSIGASSSHSFAFFVDGTSAFSPDFANKRVFARFKQSGALRGSTSVAADTTP